MEGLLVNERTDEGNLPITLKRKLLDSSILPILTYGTQTRRRIMNTLFPDRANQLSLCDTAN